MIKILLQVFSMISLRIGQAEKPLLEDGIMAIPKGRREAEATVAIANAEQTILSPAIHP